MPMTDDDVDALAMVARTFEKKLRQRTDPASSTFTILAVIADLIGAGLDTYRELEGIDEPELPFNPDALIRFTDREIREEGYDIEACIRTCNDEGKSMHLVLVDSLDPREILPEYWAQGASVITLEDKDGRLVSILKNRFGAES